MKVFGGKFYVLNVSFQLIKPTTFGDMKGIGLRRRSSNKRKFCLMTFHKSGAVAIF